MLHDELETAREFSHNPKLKATKNKGKHEENKDGANQKRKLEEIEHLEIHQRK